MPEAETVQQMFANNGNNRVASPFDMTFIVGYCNGYWNYIISDSAYEYTNYEFQTSRYVRGSGGTMMAHSFSQSDQGVIAVRVNGNDGTQITLTDSNGKVLVDHTPELGFALVILSTPEMVKGQTYTLTVGNTTNSITAN